MKETQLTSRAKKEIEIILSGSFDPETKQRTKELQNNIPLANDIFGFDIEFGTAGLRGVMDVGPNRINIYTIRKASQGLANYIKKEQVISPSVAICFDPRINSKRFALEAARVLAANNIKVYITADLRPTPFLSFALRELNCIAGINITASHNPKNYNGYKVYYQDGAQITPPHDAGIIQEVEAISSKESIPLSPEDSPLIHIIEKTVEENYLYAIKELAINPSMSKKYGNDLKIIYSPLNGAGITMIPEALNQRGFNNISLVESQKNPDGNFPTIPKPNPELEKTLAEGIELLKSNKADILLVSDPDSDRLSCTLFHNNKVTILTGNEFGTLLLHYILENRTTLPTNFATVTTIVSTRLVNSLTKAYGGTCFETLTGFKYIGEKIYEWEKDSTYSFLFGMEESLGYLYGTHARDKDATIASCLAAEMALDLKKKNLTLIDQLYSIYKKYGLYREGQRSIEFTIEQKADVFKKLEDMRHNPPKHINQQKVVGYEDYLSSTKVSSEGSTSLTLPQANVLVYFLEDGSKIIIRPSGTEPKIKIYGSVKETNLTEQIDNEIIKLDTKLEKLLLSINNLFVDT